MINKEKAIGQFERQVSAGVLPVFRLYGQDAYFLEVTKELTRLALLLHRRLNGEDIPIV